MPQSKPLQKDASTALTQEANAGNGADTDMLAFP